jgi:hypothetical protein
MSVALYFLCSFWALFAFLPFALCLGFVLASSCLPELARFGACAALRFARLSMTNKIKIFREGRGAPLTAWEPKGEEAEAKQRAKHTRGETKYDKLWCTERD